jgi:hypothetical protein
VATGDVMWANAGDTTIAFGGEKMRAQDKMWRVAPGTAATWQNGAYLSEYLLGLGYTVDGTKRRSSSSFNTARIDHPGPHLGNGPFWCTVAT